MPPGYFYDERAEALFLGMSCTSLSQRSQISQSESRFSHHSTQSDAVSIIYHHKHIWVSLIFLQWKMFWMQQYISIAQLKSKSKRYSFTLFYLVSRLNLIQLKTPSVTLITLNLVLYQNLGLAIDEWLKRYWNANKCLEFLTLWYHKNLSSDLRPNLWSWPAHLCARSCRAFCSWLFSHLGLCSSRACSTLCIAGLGTPWQRNNAAVAQMMLKHKGNAAFHLVLAETSGQTFCWMPIINRRHSASRDRGSLAPRSRVRPLICSSASRSSRLWIRDPVRTQSGSPTKRRCRECWACFFSASLKR